MSCCIPKNKKEREALKLRSMVFCKTYGKCSYCGDELTFDNFQMDHVLPRSKGGCDNIENLRPSFFSCNMSKGTRNLEEFREKITAKIQLGKHQVLHILRNAKLAAVVIRWYRQHPYRFWFERGGT
jgi:5-methylcytosine-specific restriction endonuclease McrA